MKKLIILTSISTSLLLADFKYSISKISPKIEQRMRDGGSYKNYCPVSLNSLRYIKLKYIDFNKKEQWGELIVNKAIAKDIVDIFKKLYEIKYPIKKMNLVSNYKGSDFASIEADNTSAFNCRYVDGTKKWSNHTYGRAIDINPIENPYVSNNGYTSHEASKKYLIRANQKGVLLANSYIVKLFKRHGFRWGGSWRCCKDYQHFDKK